VTRRDRFDVVARLRRIREDQARAEVGRADADVRAAEDAVARARDGRRVPVLPPEPLPAAMLRALHLTGIRSRELLDLATEEHERTVARRRESVSDLQRAAVARRSVERLAQRRTAEAISARAAAAERALDDLVLLRGSDASERGGAS
jgi:flagellar biosynthesis chaperone FliJ